VVVTVLAACRRGPDDATQRRISPDNKSVCIEEVRVVVGWDVASNLPTRQFGTRKVGVKELESLLEDARQDYVDLRKPSVPFVIDAAPDAHWEDILETYDAGRRAGFEAIELAAPGGAFMLQRPGH
jgi:hypothetical protein